MIAAIDAWLIADIVLAILLVLVACTVIFLIMLIGEERLDRRRARAPRRRDVDEPPEALEAFGVDISVWPSRAPRNGTSEEASA